MLANASCLAAIQLALDELLQQLQLLTLLWGKLVGLLRGRRRRRDGCRSRSSLLCIFRGHDTVDDFLGCLGLCDSKISMLTSCFRGAAWKGAGQTHDQRAHKVLYLILAKIQVFVCGSKLRKVEGQLFFNERAPGEVGLLQGAWCSRHEACTLSGSLAPQLLKSSTRMLLAGKVVKGQSVRLLLDLVNEVEFDAGSGHAVDDTLFSSLIVKEFRPRVLALVLSDVHNTVVAEAA